MAGKVSEYRVAIEMPVNVHIFISRVFRNSIKTIVKHDLTFCCEVGRNSKMHRDIATVCYRMIAQ